MKSDTPRPKEVTDSTNRSPSPERRRSRSALEQHVMALSPEQMAAADARKEAEKSQIKAIKAALEKNPSSFTHVVSGGKVYATPKLGFNEEGENEHLLFTRIDSGGKTYVVSNLGFNEKGKREHLLFTRIDNEEGERERQAIAGPSSRTLDTHPVQDASDSNTLEKAIEFVKLLPNKLIYDLRVYSRLKASPSSLYRESTKETYREIVSLCDKAKKVHKNFDEYVDKSTIITEEQCDAAIKLKEALDELKLTASGETIKGFRTEINRYYQQAGLP